LGEAAKGDYIRIDAVLRRWLDLFAYAAVSSSIMVLWGDVPSPLIDAATRPFGQLPASVSCGSLAVLVGVVAWMLGAGRWLGPRRLKYAITYPPLGCAMLLGLAAVLTVRGATEGWDHVTTLFEDSLWAVAAVPLWLWGLLTAPLLYRLLADRMLARLISRRSTRGANDLWFANDDPIEDPRDAREKLNEIARRMAKRLAAPDRQPSAMALEGDFGAGKTTVGCLLAHHLRATPDVLFASVSLWPYDSADGAVSSILNEVQRTLGERVDTTALTGISSEYVAVAQGLGGVWAAALQLLRPSHDPAEVIAHVDRILTCAGLRLVLWIDDLERFAEPVTSCNSTASKTDRGLARPVLALLHLLDQASRITVVLSGTTQAVRIDPGKIARFVERIPYLNADEVRSKIERLREQCQAMNVIDPMPRALRAKAFRGEQDLDASVADLLATETIPDLATACAALICTPRNLKAVLRSTDECWRNIPGEIDFDSMLVATVIRVTRPDLFAMLNDHVRRLRIGHVTIAAGPKESPKHASFELLVSTLGSEPEWPDRAALTRLIGSVLPEALRDKAWGKDYLDSPQSVGVNRHADYWSRYMAQAIPAGELLDQPLLRDIAKWKRGDDASELIRRLLDPAASAQLESFAGQFSGEELCRLLEEYCSAITSGSLGVLPYSSEQPGIIAIWRMMHARRPAMSRVEVAVEKVLVPLAGHNLALAFDVHYYFTYPGGAVTPLVEPSVSERLYQLLRNALLDSLRTPESLIRALRVEQPYSVLQAVWGLPRVRAGQLDGLPMPRWPDFAATLLDAAEMEPGLVLPHIVPFITQTGTRDDVQTDESGVPRLHREHTATFIESRAKDLFDLDRLYRLFAANECPPDLDPAMRECYRVVREAATAALAKGTRRDDATTGEDGDGSATQ
jgi:hypothetical protein